MSEVKVNKISPRTNCGTVTVGDAGDSVTVTAGVPVTVNGDLKSNALKAVDGGSIISQCGTNITLGASGDTINLAAGATQSGFGRTGTVDWDTTAKTAGFTAVSGNGYFVNTTSGTITVTLPAGSAGDIISLADYAATWQTNAVTVTPNGTDKIGGVNSDVTLNTEGQSVTFIYSDSTQGWLNTMDSTSNVRASSFLTATGGTITTCGNCKIHTFTSPGTFTVTSISTNCASENTVSYLVVAGGGGAMAAQPHGSAGAGAGGFREVKTPITPYTASPLDGYPSAPNRITVTATSYPITVGAGGANGPCGLNSSGSNSIFSTITSAGGGKANGEPTTGQPGGSGAGGFGGGGGLGGGTGNSPPTTPAQGNNGGSGNDAGATSGSGAGGGAGGTGGGGAPSTGGTPGTGATTNITGSPVAYASGGAGGARGGSMGGGVAQNRNGDSNTGEGGAGQVPSATGGAGGCGGSGGSGIVIIRYKYQ